MVKLLKIGKGNQEKNMSEYKIISPPFTLKFREMSKEELKAYYKWYIDQIPERINILTKAVNSTSGYENWRPDYTPESLGKLGEWFAEKVETRERTDEEMNELIAKAPASLPGIEYPKRELTNKTFSLAIDIGMYLSQVFLKNIPSLKWQHITKGSKNYIDYGRPVIARFGNLVFEPTHMMVVQAYSLADKTWGGSSLRKLFETWREMADK